MKITMYQVDAFAEAVFRGNPAAVVKTEDELGGGLMQDIAAENNLAETAFLSGPDESLKIRWFTPTVEVDLCGHATLASAHVLFTEFEGFGDAVEFDSKSGPLRVTKAGEILWLDFPADLVEPLSDGVAEIEACFDVKPESIHRGKTDFMVVLNSEAQVRGFEPDFVKIASLPCRGLIVTARGDEVDFVSRFFGPQSGVPEDAVTGSAHTLLTPYWAKELEKSEMNAQQLSKRSGNLTCKSVGDRVHIGGKAVTYFRGEIEV